MALERPRYAAKAELFIRRPERAGRVRFAGLWVAGDVAGLASPAVAVVGSRAPSDGARSHARELGRRLAAAGVTVLSGLALGIDGAAHLGALDGDGRTIGILGGGHGHFFPARNRPLAERMLEAGGAVLSPFPPEEPARPWQFLARNAVVAALADAVVVVEAAARSGALNTASWAADLAVDVFAFPGDVDRPKAAGCNALIRDGATLVRDADDVLAGLGLIATPAPATRDSHADGGRGFAGPLETALANLLDEPRTLDELVAGAAADPGAVLAALVQLELAGAVERREGQRFARP